MIRARVMLALRIHQHPLQVWTPKEVKNMAVHHGGKVGKAGKTLAAKGSSKSAKSKAGTTLANHKAKAH